ncbi:MAG: hypothetical protein ACRDKJ_05990, partial [Actinomycetota bacterium]
VIDQAAETPVMSSVMPEIDFSSDNVSFVTGVAPVTQSATARVSPAALAFGGGSSSAVVTAVVPVVQDASPAVTLSLDQIASPTGLGLVSTSARSFVRLDEAGSSPVTSTVSPAINATAANTATIIGSSPVDQQATANAAPTAAALAGLGAGTSATLRHVGDNVQDVDVDFTLIGGDAIAGSNVIAVAATGTTNIVATNDSMFATSEGGDTSSIAGTLIENGPRLTASAAGANAMGVGTQGQIAATPAPAARSDRAVAPPLGSVLTTVLTRTGVPTAP